MAGATNFPRAMVFGATGAPFYGADSRHGASPRVVDGRDGIRTA